MKRRSYVVALKEPGSKRPYLFHTCATSTTDAERKAHVFHPRWRVVSTEVEAAAQ